MAGMVGPFSMGSFERENLGDAMAIWNSNDWLLEPLFERDMSALERSRLPALVPGFRRFQRRDIEPVAPQG